MTCGAPRWILVLAVAVLVATSGWAQTFQYSRGWKNGKRAGVVAPPRVLDLATLVAVLAHPCQLDTYKYMLDGKPFAGKVLYPCEYGRGGGADEEEKETRTGHDKDDAPRADDQLIATFLQN